MRKFLIVTMLLAATVFTLPTESYGRDRSITETGGQNRQWDERRRNRNERWDDRRGRRHNRGRVRDTHGYRNYGQYRRTQVGNRRFRMVRRPFWNNGIRRSRLVRVYY